ncbi:DNA polymerase III subunit alpha [Bacillus sp. CGMCC 1.16541]|uniref:DNA polymerase III subunit alpha n=1 Tax=Bacillus sp. CGMCC 1.16541 TaxID=2185143 RepID=UPI000D73C575|nr:DNA polymerase III subunit alpha [Bacillus sp. CGMCC 1.16541]
MPFVHLQVQSSYSLLQSSIKIDELVHKAKQLQYDSVALTDENVMYGIVPFYKACKAKGIKPIIGLTLSILHSQNDEESRAYPMVLLAESEVGYRNLLKMSSIVQTKEQKGLNRKWLPHYREGVIAITPGSRGEIETLIEQGHIEEAEKSVQFFQHLFGENHFYLSVQQHGHHNQPLQAKVIELARKSQVPVVVTNDVRYLEKEQHFAQDCLVAIKQGTELDDEQREKLEGSEYYLKSKEEITELFLDVPEGLANTISIAERCQVELPLGANVLPKYPVPTHQTANEYLKHLCEKGLKERVPNVSNNYIERLQFELHIIQSMNFSDYFLIVWDFMDYAHRNGIITGPGRGSAAGSLVAYVLRITNVDPIKHDLLFERFLNPERISMPDIDIDFPDTRRDEVIQYVAQKYGQLHVAQIITFGTLAAKAAIRDVGKVIGATSEDISMLSKLIPNKVGITLRQAYDLSQPLREVLSQSPKARQVFETATKIEGLPRHTSTHAAGVVISEKPLTDVIALQEGSNDVYLTQFPMGALEDIGLLKMDFLGLRNLTILDEVVKQIKRETGEQINLDSIPADDHKTFLLLAKGDTTGIFQLESEGMRKVLKQLKPTELEDIVAVNALYRPGPMEHIPVYIRRKHKQESVHYPHPVLESILNRTYGVIVYQEQIMQIASRMAGFTLGEADLLRRAVSKKNKQVLDEQRNHFVQGCLKEGYDEQVAQSIYDLIVRFANYGFNRSHAVAYSMVAYQLAYLKANYPVQFFSALLTSVIGNEAKLGQYIQEIKQRHLTLLPPSINKSFYPFKVENGQIRYSLAAIKHVGIAALKEIVKERKKKPFDDLFDFCIRVSMRIINRKVLESLILAGCFDEFKENRATLLASIDVAMEHANLVQPTEDSDGFFDEEFMLKPKYVVKEELSLEERLKHEKEVLGFYLSSHPVSAYKDIRIFNQWKTIYQLSESVAASNIETIVFLGRERVIRTKKGEEMAFFTISDETGELDAVSFPNVYNRFSMLLKSGEVLLIRGKLEDRDYRKQFVIQHVQAADQIKEMSQKAELYVKIEQKHKTPTTLRQIRQLLSAYNGSVPVILYYEDEKRMLRLPNEYAINANDTLINELKRMLGDLNVVLK